jgi:integrase
MLTDTKIKNLKPEEKHYQVADEGGLFIEVRNTGTKSWRLRYRMGGRGSAQEKISLGDYPLYSLADARLWRDSCKGLVKRGLSPMALKRGDPIPDDAVPEVMQLGQTFIRDWCLKAHTKAVTKAEAAKELETVEGFAEIWFTDVVMRMNSNHKNVKRVLEKDVFPMIGGKHIASVTVGDVLAITDRIKNRGADQMALHTRNLLKRLFAYAIARGKVQFNPAAAIEGRYIAQTRSRDVALTPSEIGRLLRSIYQSNMKRCYKLGLHLLILCMTRKSELIEARWEEIDLEKAVWEIPGERMKKDKPHVIPLSRQAVAMFDELRGLSSGSDWVFPSRSDLKQPIAKATLNQAVRTMELDVQSFVIHDFRRTASTHLHEAGFNSDWVEKCLAHEQQGVRGVYNRAQYIDQRREMLQWWADFIDSQIQTGTGKVIIGPFGKAYQAA